MTCAVALSVVLPDSVGGRVVAAVVTAWVSDPAGPVVWVASPVAAVVVCAVVACGLAVVVWAAVA